MNFIDVGDRFGKLTVLEKTDFYNNSNRVLYRCVCDCGEETLSDNSGLTKTTRPSCGKCTTRNGIDLPYGQTFGKLTFVKRFYDENGKAKYLWKCGCGNDHVAPISNVMRGSVASCGCLGKELGVAETNKRYAGKKYNMLTYKEHAWKWNGPGEGKNPVAVWTCDCGEEKEILIGSVTSGRTTCCGCETGRDGGKSDLGKKWNKLTLIELAGKRGTMNKGKFLCDCGNITYGSIPNVRNGQKKSCGCDMSETLREKRGFTLDETKFETITEESAYWLGFMLADGNVSKNTITINLKTGDRSHLEKFRAFMGGNQTISLKKDVRMSGYAFGSIKVTKDLSKWGIVPNKSLIAEVHPELKNNRHFWRGVIDGDGSVVFREGIIKCVSLCGTKSVCDDFLAFANLVSNNRSSVKKVKENLWNVRIGVGRINSSKLIRVLYEDCTIYLDRKHKTAMDIIADTEKRHGR